VRQEHEQQYLSLTMSAAEGSDETGSDDNDPQLAAESFRSPVNVAPGIPSRAAAAWGNATVERRAKLRGGRETTGGRAGK
jgi:hypothetical protein